MEQKLSRRSFLKRKSRRMTAAGYVRGALLAGILASGLFLVIRNTAGANLSPGFIIFLDLTHLGLVMAFLFVSLYCLVLKKKWTTTALSINNGEIK